MDDLRILNETKLLHLYKPNYSDAVKLQWHGHIIRVRPLIRVSELEELLSSIDQLSVVDENKFSYAQADFAKRFYVIDYYTDVQLPERIDDAYWILYDTDIFSSVSSVINAGQLNVINSHLQ